MASSGRLRTRGEIIRRRRRERQVFVFGLILLALAALSFLAYGVYVGRAESPIDYAFVTPEPDFESQAKIPCPPIGDDALPMPADEIAVRTLNGTEESGLARTFLDDLTGRGFVGVKATNWNRSYDGMARITFGKDGLRQAYTVANQFTEYELVYDNREGALIDIILGAKAVDAELRPLYAPELDPTVELTAPGPCLPIDLLFPEPAPARLPADPLHPASPSPSASASATS